MERPQPKGGAPGPFRIGQRPVGGRHPTYSEGSTVTMVPNYILLPILAVLLVLSAFKIWQHD